MTDVTIEVIDNKGNVVEVKPVDLVKGETVASFKFEREFTNEPEGVWTVGGVKIDLDLTKNLKAVYNNVGNEVKLFDALKTLNLENVSADNIKKYADALAKMQNPADKENYVGVEDFTKADAQKVVNAGNKAADEAKDAKVVAKSVKDATNQVQLLNALSSFDRVNKDWISSYETAINALKESPGITEDADGVKAIQNEVNKENTKKLAAVTTGIVTKLDLDGTNASTVEKDLKEARVAVVSFMTPDGKGETAKEETIRKIDRQLAIREVLDAARPAQLTVAINKLKSVDAAYELSMDNFKDANRAEYIKALDADSGTNHPFNTITKINDELVVVNLAQAATPINNIKTAAGETDAKLLAALKAYGDVKYVADANKADYFTFASGKTAGGESTGYLTTGFDAVVTKADVQELVNAANLKAVTEAANATDNNTTPALTDTLYKALVNYGELKDLNVSNKTYYAATAIADVIKAVNFGNENEVVAAKALVQAQVDLANVAAVKAANNSAEALLAKLNIITVNDFADVVKAENTPAYLEDVKKLDAGEIKTETVTVANLKTAITNINNAQASEVTLKAINNATTVEEMHQALLLQAEDKYINTPSADRLWVAERVLAARNDIGDKKFAAIGNAKTSVDTHADARVTALNAVNDLLVGSPTTGTGSVIVALSLVDADFAKLTPAKQAPIAEAFHNGLEFAEATPFKVAPPFRTLEAIQNAVDAIVAAQ